MPQSGIWGARWSTAAGGPKSARAKRGCCSSGEIPRRRVETGPSHGEGRTTDRVLPSPRMRCWPVARHYALVSALRSPHHVPKRWVILLVVGVALALLGLLWFLQGVGAVQVRPILCVSNCKPVEKSVGWLIAGVGACMAGITITTMSARHLHHR
jgi:hypothetical protein